MSQTFYKKGFLALAVAAALGVSAFAQADVKIGVAGPMTGANAAFGEQYMKGAQAAADAINAKGGVNGEKIVLVKGDDACEPKQAVAVANNMVTRTRWRALSGTSAHRRPSRLPRSTPMPASSPSLQVPPTDR